MATEGPESSQPPTVAYPEAPQGASAGEQAPPQDANPGQLWHGSCSDEKNDAKRMKRHIDSSDEENDAKRPATTTRSHLWQSIPHPDGAFAFVSQCSFAFVFLT